MEVDKPAVVLPAVDGVTPELLPDKDRVYYNDYSTLVQQQDMLQDQVRTSLYQFAMLENKADFKGKSVLDVGKLAPGTGFSTSTCFPARMASHRTSTAWSIAILSGYLEKHGERVADDIWRERDTF